jgi:transcriptional regulator with XRE-family HTH domain
METELTNEKKVMIELGKYIERKMKEQEPILKEKGMLKEKQVLSQSKFSSMIGISTVWLNNIIHGIKFPNDKILVEIADKLYLDQDEIFKVARRLPPKIVEEMKKDFLGEYYIPNLEL